MTRDEARRLVGQMFAIRFPQSWDDVDLERFPVANYIVFRDVLGPSFEASRLRFAEARKILTERQQSAGKRVPLADLGMSPLFMLDEEGGRVTQTSQFFQSVPSPRAVAKTLTPEDAASLYFHLAAYLADMGLAVNLAPCLDVNTETLNPIIGTRAFGADPESVSSFARHVIPRMRRRLACVAKHFPGHGMTRLDSHLALPVVHETREALEEIHIAPFREAISAGVDGIMISHCLYPSLQTDDLPASLSRQIVRDYLRGELGYDGAVLSDSLDMQAVTEAVHPEKAARLAIEAGCDLLVYTEYSERFMAAFETVVEMAIAGLLSEDRLAESALKLRGGAAARLLRRGLRKLADSFRRTPRSEEEETFNVHAYLDLLFRARSGSVRVGKGRARLPLATDAASIVATSPAIAGKLRPHIRKLVELPEAGDPSGRPLILWLMEPLFLRQSLEALRALIARAPVSILVTTYEQLASDMKGADVVILSDDTSPYAEDSIISLVFEGVLPTAGPGLSARS